MDKGFQKVQYAFSQQVAKAVDPYVPFDTGTLKNSVNQASDFKGGKLVYNTPYARRQYYLHTQGQGLAWGEPPARLLLGPAGHC